MSTFSLLIAPYFTDSSAGFLGERRQASRSRRRGGKIHLLYCREMRRVIREELKRRTHSHPILARRGFHRGFVKGEEEWAESAQCRRAELLMVGVGC